MPLVGIISRPPPIDRSHAGRVVICLDSLAKLLRLPPGQEIAAAETTANGDIILTVEGAELPPRRQGRPENINLLCWAEDGGRTLRLGWQHQAADPSKRWLLYSDPQPEAPADAVR